MKLLRARVLSVLTRNRATTFQNSFLYGGKDASMQSALFLICVLTGATVAGALLSGLPYFMCHYVFYVCRRRKRSG